MSTDVLLAQLAVPLQELSNDDVARATLIVTGIQAITGMAGVAVPFIVMRSVMDETARREELKKEEQRLIRVEEREERKEEKQERKEEKQADRLTAVVLAAAAILSAASLAVYLKN